MDNFWNWLSTSHIVSNNASECQMVTSISIDHLKNTKNFKFLVSKFSFSVIMIVRNVPKKVTETIFLRVKPSFLSFLDETESKNAQTFDLTPSSSEDTLL